MQAILHTAVCLALTIADDDDYTGDDDILQGNVPVAEEQSLAFTDAGAWLSFLAAGGLALLQIFMCRRDSNTYNRVRPRMLLALVLFDASAGICLGLADVPSIALAVKDNKGTGGGIDHILDFLGFFFTYASFCWTCCIAYHAHLVTRKGLAADSEQEKWYEKMYWAATGVIMLLVFFPLQCYFYFVQRGYRSAVGARHFLLTLAVFLCVAWVWVGGICVHLHMHATSNAVVRAYRRQIMWFLLVFLALTIQPTVYYILVYLGATNHADTSANDYLQYFGVNFFEYMVWCAVRYSETNVDLVEYVQLHVTMQMHMLKTLCNFAKSPEVVIVPCFMAGLFQRAHLGPVSSLHVQLHQHTL
jgi:hypothetical protein